MVPVLSGRKSNPEAIVEEGRFTFGLRKFPGIDIVVDRSIYKTSFVLNRMSFVHVQNTC
jgi:hypothetical protein